MNKLSIKIKKFTEINECKFHCYKKFCIELYLHITKSEVTSL